MQIPVLRRAKRRADRTGDSPAPDAHPIGASTESLTVHFDDVVTTGRGVFVRGWAFDASGALTDATIGIGDVAVAIREWQPRPDVVAANPGLGIPTDCGFAVHVPFETTHDIVLGARAPSGSVAARVRTADRRPEPDHNVLAAFDAFVDWANAGDRRVLEIGSRVVVTPSLRSRFGKGQYVGFDIHADENTDIVGDAHRLADYVNDGAFDAVFSMYVLEHLAMPWLVAAEINKVLRRGGRTFHATNQTWPMHAWPWDFFRFSSEGLNVLFSRPVGFQVLESGHSDRVEVHVPHDPQQAAIPTEPAYASSWVLALKTSDPHPSLQWGAATSDVTGGTSYPLPGQP